MSASVVLEGPIERERAPRRDGTEAFATGRNGRGDLAQRSREIGNALLGGASPPLGDAPIVLFHLKCLLDLFDLCAKNVELARIDRTELLARRVQVFAVLTCLLRDGLSARLGLHAQALDSAQLGSRPTALLA